MCPVPCAIGRRGTCHEGIGVGLPGQHALPLALQLLQSRRPEDLFRALHRPANNDWPGRTDRHRQIITAIIAAIATNRTQTANGVYTVRFYERIHEDAFPGLRVTGEEWQSTLHWEGTTRGASFSPPGTSVDSAYEPLPLCGPRFAVVCGGRRYPLSAAPHPAPVAELLRPAQAEPSPPAMDS
jgi:hypothetical protein